MDLKYTKSGTVMIVNGTILMQPAPERTIKPNVIVRSTNGAFGIVKSTLSDYCDVEFISEDTSEILSVETDDLEVYTPYLKCGKVKYELTYSSYSLLLKTPQDKWIYEHEGKVINFKNRAGVDDRIRVVNILFYGLPNEGVIIEILRGTEYQKPTTFYVIKLGIKTVSLKRSDFVLLNKDETYETVKLICLRCGKY